MGLSSQGQRLSHAPPRPARRGDAIVAALTGLTAAWIAAGSVGLLAHPLRRVLTALVLLGGVFVLARWPLPPWRRWGWSLMQVGTVAACLAAPQSALHVLGCALALGWLAASRAGETSPALRAAAPAALLFALYHYAVALIPWGWWVADRAAQSLSAAVSAVLPWPLSAGPTFAGLDYLVLSVAFCLFLAAHSAQPGGSRRALRWIGAVLVAHLVYLVLLASFPKWRVWLPDIQIKSPFPGLPGKPKPLGEVVIWQLPLMGLLLHLPVLALAAWRLGRRQAETSPIGVQSQIKTTAEEETRQSRSQLTRVSSWSEILRSWSVPAVAALVLGLAVPVLSLLQPTPLSLRGRKIVVYEKGFLNWLKPEHGQYGRLTVGMYGMWPMFFEHYGARCLISPELSAQDLEGADLLVLIFPNRPWEPGQLERIHNYVARGGALLVLGEHTVREKDGGNRFNDVLGPTAMRVAFDSAMFGVGGWLHSYQALAHPASLGIRDDRNQFGVVIGASVTARWPARPLLVGRWGWNDPGDPSNDETKGGSMMGNQKYDAGERLGDVLLAAEQRWGRGRVVVFGDTSGFTNGILYGSHPYVAALMAALCQRVEFAGWRHVLGLIGLVALGALVVKARQPAVVLTGTIALAAGTAAASAWTARMANVLPDGRKAGPNMLAYVDATHLERASAESWRPSGLGGLQLTLMRNGYLPLALPEFTSARLERAGLVFCAAPGRPFTARERAAVRRFVENGGIFILTAGWPESAASRSLLADFGFYVGNRGAAEGFGPEPKPFGHFKAPYYNGGDYMAYVRFHAGWSVECIEPDAQPLAYGPRNPLTGADPMVIAMRRIGRGKIVVVADTHFASCQNLENEDGSPFEGMRENADFWRWLLTFLNDQPVWTPPRPAVHRHNAPRQPPAPEEQPLPQSESSSQREPRTPDGNAGSAPLRPAVSQTSNPQPVARDTTDRPQTERAVKFGPVASSS